MVIIVLVVLVIIIIIIAVKALREVLELLLLLLDVVRAVLLVLAQSFLFFLDLLLCLLDDVLDLLRRELAAGLQAIFFLLPGPILLGLRVLPVKLIHLGLRKRSGFAVPLHALLGDTVLDEEAVAAGAPSVVLKLFLEFCDALLVPLTALAYFAMNPLDLFLYHFYLFLELPLTPVVAVGQTS